ncbi:hypothetical protein GLW08_10365 [Pontibacillus yanchengensis]|uniref:SLH domain-containing protein n=2 Tax=Pontibacillus yanchengensis TaxID=462910 RepID=A0A6I4ZVT1_9BACI|nr:S-layer homology domain-containing protein [Pontibacillus yanchengensis]MYL34268.1 hypothetical protein [Pontibacillus yanchengensis]MYL53739.1 hypothetical protein [Pontibacillus yanchengensis]
MAFQPKSYRKFMVASASAALVGTAVAPAVSAATAAEDFTDVSEDTRHYEHINALYDMGVVSGYGDGTFGPDNNLKRSEAAEMVFTARGLNANADATMTFEDVPPRIEEEIATLYQEEIFDGYSEVKFGPDMELNRAEMAKIVIEAFDLQKEDGEYEDAPFSDLKDTKLYPYINAVYALDIADGYEDGEFGVHDNILRKDFSKMLHNAWKIWNEDAELTVSEVGQVKDPLNSGVYAVEIKRDALQEATLEGEVTTETEVSLDVDGETVELSYNEDRDSFRNQDITGYTMEELNNAVVDYEPEMEIGKGIEVGTVAEVEGQVVDIGVASLKGVQISLENLQSAEDTVTTESDVSLMVDGETVELEYLEDEDTFRNAQISGYTEDQLAEATVVVK